MAIDALALPAARDSAHYTAGAQSGVGRLQKAADAETPRAANDASPTAGLTEQELTALGAEVVQDWERDKNGNSKWRTAAKAALEAAAQLDGIGEDGLPVTKNTPWPNASNVKYPLLTTAVLQFAARAYAAIVKSDEVAMVEAMGPDPKNTKAQRAERQRLYLNHTIFYQVEGWDADTDAMLHTLAAAGAHFRKVYVDPDSGKQCMESVSALRVTKTHDARSLRESPRVTHDYDVFPTDVRRKIKAKVWADVTLPDNTDDKSSPRLILEQHLWRDFDDDGLDEPYIVTVDHATQRVLRVDDAWDDRDIKRGHDGLPKQFDRWLPFAGYDLIPDIMGGSYGQGFGKLIAPLAAVIDTILNQSLDAGSMQAAGGGFVGAEVRLQGAGRNGRIRRQPGEYITVSASGADLRNAIVEADKPAVSDVQFKLLGMIMDAASGVISAGDVINSDSAQNIAPTTILAMIEQTAMVNNAIQKRIYRGMGDEQWLLAQCISRWGDAKAYCDFLDMDTLAQQHMERPMTPAEQEEFFREDWDLTDMSVRPVGDPSSSTRMQAAAKGQVASQYLEKNIYTDDKAVVRWILENAGIEQADQWIPDVPAQPNPLIAVMQQLQQREAAAKAALLEAKVRQADAQGSLFTAQAAQIVDSATGPSAELDQRERVAQASIHLASAAATLEGLDPSGAANQVEHAKVAVSALPHVMPRPADGGAPVAAPAAVPVPVHVPVPVPVATPPAAPMTGAPPEPLPQ